MQQRSRSRTIEIAVWCSLIALVSAICLQKIYSNDYWWHLRTGWWILENGAVPRADFFSYTAVGERWLDIHWLFQVILYAIYSLGGHVGVGLAQLVSTLATLGLAASVGYRPQRAALTAFALALTLMTLHYRIMPRPELASFVFLAAELAMLHRYRETGGRWIFGIIGIQLLWVNVHGLFAVGLVLCAIYWVDATWRAVRGEDDWRPSAELGALLAGSLAISLCNPNTFDALLYPLQQLGMLGTLNRPADFAILVNELLPPFHPRSAITPLAAAFPATLAVWSAGAMAANWRRVRLAEILTWLAFTYLGLIAQRNLALFAIAVAPLAVLHTNDWLDARPRERAASARFGVALSVALIAALLLGAVDVASNRFYRRIGIPRELGFGGQETRFPMQELDWIEKERPPGPIYHPLEFGGYLLWRLYPEYSSLLDGRLEVFGYERLVGLNAQSVEQFRALDAHYHFGTLIVPNDGRMPLHSWLYLSPSWRLEMASDVAAVFVRASADWGRDRPELDLDDGGLLPPIESYAAAQQMERRRKRINFYTAFGRHETALALLDEALAEDPDLAGGIRLQGQLRAALNAQQR